MDANEAGASERVQNTRARAPPAPPLLPLLLRLLLRLMWNSHDCVAAYAGAVFAVVLLRLQLDSVVVTRKTER